MSPRSSLGEGQESVGNQAYSFPGRTVIILVNVKRTSLINWKRIIMFSVSLQTMVKYQRLQCLTHTLCSVLMDIKWYDLILLSYYTIAFFYRSGVKFRSSPALWIPDKAGVYFFPPVDSLIMLIKSLLIKTISTNLTGQNSLFLTFFLFLLFLGVNLASYVRCWTSAFTSFLCCFWWSWWRNKWTPKIKWVNLFPNVTEILKFRKIFFLFCRITHRV